VNVGHTGLPEAVVNAGVPTLPGTPAIEPPTDGCWRTNAILPRGHRAASTG